MIFHKTLCKVNAREVKVLIILDFERFFLDFRRLVSTLHLSRNKRCLASSPTLASWIDLGQFTEYL